MSLQVEKLEKNMAKLTIEVSAEDLEKAMQAAYQKAKGRITLPGFRKGKAPRKMIEQMYGKGIFLEDAANALIPEAYSKAYDESGLEIVSQPKIDVTQIEKGKPFIFTAEVATKPEVELGEYKGIEVPKYSNRVTQKEIDAKLEEEQLKNARTITVEGRPVQDKDEVVLDFEGFVDGEAFEGGKGENYPLTIGSGSFIPGFEEQLIGAEPEKEVEVKVTFPEDYHAEDLKGKEAVFKCTVHEIKAKELPELDDEFASEVSEFDTLDELKADIKAKIKEQKVNDGKRAQEDAAVDAIIESAKMDLPEAMVDTQARQMLDEFAQRMQQQGLTLDQYMQFTGMTADKMMDELRPQAEKRIKTRLVLEAIAKTIEKENNPARLISKIEKTNPTYTASTEIIDTILSDLMLREQEKVKNGFIERCSSRFPEFKLWDEIYKEKEQLVRISSLILFNESSYNDYPIEILPDAMKDDYEKIVNKFIRDHPFLLARSEQSQTKIDFTGPAFRDYAPCACSSLP